MVVTSEYNLNKALATVTRVSRRCEKIQRLGLGRSVPASPCGFRAVTNQQQKPRHIDIEASPTCHRAAPDCARTGRAFYRALGLDRQACIEFPQYHSWQRSMLRFLKLQRGAEGAVARPERGGEDVSPAVCPGQYSG